jgi:hypothetical protein
VNPAIGPNPLDNLRDKMIDIIVEMDWDCNGDSYYEMAREQHDEAFPDEEYEPDSDDALTVCRAQYEDETLEKLTTTYLEAVDETAEKLTPQERLLLYTTFPWTISMVDGDPTRGFSFEEIFDLVKHNPENVEYVTFTPTAIQEYILKTRPDLVGKLQNFDKSLKVKYQHEKELGNVDL